MRFGIFVMMAGREAGGPETYEHCLVKALAELDQQNEYHVFCLDRSAADSFHLKQDNIFYHVLWPKARLINIPASLPIALVRKRLDLLHATFIPPPYSPLGYVFTMHCFSTFNHPEFYPRRILWRLNRGIVKGLKHARLTLCVSESVRDLTAEKFKMPPENLVVVYNGSGPNFRPVPAESARRDLRSRYQIDGPFFLNVGQIKARKNIIRLLEAFHRFCHEVDDNIKLVLAGRRSWTSEGVDETIARLGLKDKVIELGHIAHDDLPILYSAAEMFVFPSLWEGFGIPIIEAMACGTPVVTSNISSLPEVAGGAAMLIDPYSAEDIATGMHKVFSDSNLRQEMITKGIKRAQAFTWRQTARQTLAAYQTAQQICG